MAFLRRQLLHKRSWICSHIGLAILEREICALEKKGCFFSLFFAGFSELSVFLKNRSLIMNHIKQWKAYHMYKLLSIEFAFFFLLLAWLICVHGRGGVTQTMDVTAQSQHLWRVTMHQVLILSHFFLPSLLLLSTDLKVDILCRLPKTRARPLKYVAQQDRNHHIVSASMKLRLRTRRIVVCGVMRTRRIVACGVMLLDCLVPPH